MKNKYPKTIKEILEEDVKDRSEDDHQTLIKYFGGVRNYLLSIGKFKEQNGN